MSRLLKQLLAAAAVSVALGGSAGAQLLGGALPVPPIAVPGPVGNVPVAGPLLQNILAQPGAQQVINPTLDTVSGVTETIAQSGPQSLLELRQLRLQELIRTNRATVDSDGNGLPVRRGVVAVLNPDPVGLQAALRSGFRIAADQPNPELGLRIVSLAVPKGMSAKAGVKLLHKVAPQLQADFDHLFEPAGE